MTALTLPSSAPATPQGSMLSKTPAVGDSYDMILAYTGAANLASGTYTDTITVSVAAP